MSNKPASIEQGVKPSWGSTRNVDVKVPKERIRELRNAYGPVRKAVKKVVADAKVANAKIDEDGQTIKITNKSRHDIQNSSFQTGILLQPQIEKAKQEAEEAKTESKTDFLTKIPNRKAFMERLGEEANIIKRKIQEENKTGIKKPNTKIVVLSVDVNKFKQINDTKGHDTGDLYLINIAKLFNNNRRPGEMIARTGGDEFGALLEIEETVVYEDEVKGYYERMNKILQENGINISIGACLLDPEDIEWTLKKADEAMYRAKEKSRQNNDESFLDIDSEKKELEVLKV